MTKEKEQAAELVSTIQKIADDFLISLREQDVEPIQLPLAVAMIAHRTGQVIGIPAIALLEASLDRLKMMHDYKDAKEGKLPQNGTMDELIDTSLVNDEGSSLLAKPPTSTILTADGLPQADHNTWNQ